MNTSQKMSVAVLLIISISTPTWLYLRYKEYWHNRETDKSRISFPCSKRISQINTVVVRYLINKNKNLETESFRFNRPEDLENLAPDSIGIFDPKTVNAVYPEIHDECNANGIPPRLIFSIELKTANNPRYTPQGISYFIVGVNKEMCLIANQYMGIQDETWTWIPVTPRFTHPIVPKLKSDQSALYETEYIDKKDAPYVFKQQSKPIIDHPIFSDKDAGCFQSFDGKNYVIFGSAL